MDNEVTVNIATFPNIVVMVQLYANVPSWIKGFVLKQEDKRERERVFTYKSCLLSCSENETFPKSLAFYYFRQNQNMLWNKTNNICYLLSYFTASTALLM